MLKTKLAQKVHEQLFTLDMNVYIVLDGASIPSLQRKLYEMQPPNVCLYRGELTPDLAEVAPYLVRLERDSVFTQWDAEVDFNTLRKHFRTFLMVEGPNGKPIYFRYYDPRVLRIYLPTCNNEELATIFGPVHFYAMENRDASALEMFQAGKEPEESLATLKIRPEQYQNLIAYEWERLENECVTFVKDNWQEDFASMGEQEVRSIVGRAIERAKQYGFEREHLIIRYVNVTFALGPDFEHSADYPWAKQIFENPELRADEKIEAVESYLQDHTMVCGKSDSRTFVYQSF